MKVCLLVFGMIGITFGLCAIGGTIGYLLQMQFHFGGGWVILIGLLLVWLCHILINWAVFVAFKKQGRMKEYDKWQREHPFE